MKVRKLMAMFVGCAVMTGLFGGCGNTGDKRQTNTSAQISSGESKSAVGKSIVYWSMWEPTEPQGAAIQKIIEQYTADTGVKVEVEFKGRTGQREGLQAALDAGTNIDMFDEDISRVNQTWGKYLLNLEDLVKESNYESTALPAMMIAAREEGGGQIMSIPYQPNINVFFYNKKHFKDAGITEVPKTFDGS